MLTYTTIILKKYINSKKKVTTNFDESIRKIKSIKIKINETIIIRRINTKITSK
jgi:hypothetical protein